MEFWSRKNSNMTKKRERIRSSFSTIGTSKKYSSNSLSSQNTLDSSGKKTNFLNRIQLFRQKMTGPALPEEIEMNVQPETRRVTFQNDPSLNVAVLKSRHKVVRLLIILLSCFAINVFPYQFQLIISKFGWFEEFQRTEGYKLFVIISLLLYYSHAGVNCLVYFLLSERFRQYICELFGFGKSQTKKTNQHLIVKPVNKMKRTVV